MPCLYFANRFKSVRLWEDFFARKDFGGKDTGIDLVARTHEGDYWAIQCKCFQENSTIDKPAVDSFLATSSKNFVDESGKTTSFAHRLWISTTNRWGTNAEATIRNQTPPVSRISLTDLENAPVDWQKIHEGIFGEAARAGKKSIRQHQKEALEATHRHFQTADRGKLIMACGTGKTYTALKIAENETGGRGLVLFLVPSIALLGQTLREWTAEADEPIHPICICSDAGVSQKKSKIEDADGYHVVDLALPASTDVPTILKQFETARHAPKSGMTVVFSTCQSIEVIAAAQKALLDKQQSAAEPFGVFDLIICDEAHRTTGVTIADEDESAFVKVHDADFLKAKKRLYMTATPRLFSDNSKSRAAQAEAVLCSMDDEKIYGPEMYRIGFGEAVEKDLLSDYKVLVLTMNEADVPAAVQKSLADQNLEIKTDDPAKLIGCINALAKQVLGDEGILQATDPEPMRRAVAFCASIKDSQRITSVFNATRHSYFEQQDEEIRDGVSDWVLERARKQYGERVGKEDIFYYVYGFLHHPAYREQFAADLKKMLPRLPLLDSPADFWKFSNAGRRLAELHLGYDDFSKAPSAEAIGVRVTGADAPLAPGEEPGLRFRVEKMRFPSKTDKSRILYNSHIAIENIPAAAYEYVVNGKSAIEWVMERYAVTTHKDSGIRNDPNDWASECGNPRYILDLLLSVIRLSVETVEEVRGLPGVVF